MKAKCRVTKWPHVRAECCNFSLYIWHVNSNLVKKKRMRRICTKSTEPFWCESSSLGNSHSRKICILKFTDAQNIPLQCGHSAAAKYISSQTVGISASPLTEVRDGKAGGLTGIRFTPSLPLSQVPKWEEFKPAKYFTLDSRDYDTWQDTDAALNHPDKNTVINTKA